VQIQHIVAVPSFLQLLDMIHLRRASSGNETSDPQKYLAELTSLTGGGTLLLSSALFDH